MKTAEAALEPYSSNFSRHDFTQAQFFAILVLKTFFQTDYRGIISLLEEWRELREILGLTKKVPHYTTLCQAEARLLKKRLLTYSKEPFFKQHGIGN
jgi:hypothetical protein